MQSVYSRLVKGTQTSVLQWEESLGAGETEPCTFTHILTQGRGKQGLRALHTGMLGGI